METEVVAANKIVQWLKNYATKYNLKLVVGVSGGIDSALVSTLCAMTGIETYVVSLPLHSNSDNSRLADRHVYWLLEKFRNVHGIKIDLSKVYDIFNSTFKIYDDPLTNANTKSRLRMVSLYQIAGKVKALVVGTGNKVEDFGIGFYTKYGDGGVDISPIAHLYKSEVREMAKSLGVIEDIVIAKPTDGLWDDNRGDEDQIGATYEELENIMKGNFPKNKREEEVMKIYMNFRLRNQHKWLKIPTYKEKK